MRRQPDLAATDAGTLDVYVEPCDDVSAGTYIQYSKSFLNNDPALYTVDARYTKDLYGSSLTVTAWHRDKLARIENDHNYYTCIDVVRNERVYTQLLKTDKPVSAEEIDAWATSLICYEPTAAAEPLRIGGCAYPKGDRVRALYDAWFGADAPFTWGFYLPEAPAAMYKLSTIEQQVEHKFTFLMMYSALEENYEPRLVSAPLQNAQKNGRTVMLTLQPQNAAGSTLC